MATRELPLLRHQYKAAYTAYMQHVHAVSDLSQRGECPSAEVFRAEEMAFGELSLVRLTLLDALRELSRSETTSGSLFSIVRTASEADGQGYLRAIDTLTFNL